MHAARGSAVPANNEPMVLIKALVKWLEEGGHLGCQQINCEKIQSEEDPVEQWTIRPIGETV
jgi:hypothetical protein